MESWRKTSLVLPTPLVAYSGTIRITCSGTMRIRENEQHYKSKKPDPTYLPTLHSNFRSHGLFMMAMKSYLRFLES